MSDTHPLEALRVTGYAALGLGDAAVSRARAAADDARLRARTGATLIEDLPASLAVLGGTLTTEDFVRLAQSYLASARDVWDGLVARGRDTYTRLAGEADAEAGTDTARAA